jgi:hypothetical protein
MEADVVTRLNREAFPLQPIPKMTLHQAQPCDQTMDREIPEKEWIDVGDRDAGRTWQEISDEELMSCDAALSHFDETSFVYYLPAYVPIPLKRLLSLWPFVMVAFLGSPNPLLGPMRIRCSMAQRASNPRSVRGPGTSPEIAIQNL